VSIFFRFLTTMTPDDIYFSYPTPTPMATELSPRYPEYHRPSDGDTVTQSHESGGVILEGPPVTLGWSHLYYYVSIKNKGEKQKLRRCLLDDVTGIAPPGHLLAIMGPSGAGKTSLLNALAGRLPKSNHGELQGDITINGRPRDKFFRQMVGYVMQDDVFFSNLTVLETLTLAARLKLPKAMSTAEKDEVVQKVVLELSLSQAINTRIGGVGIGGISGGEKKRVNVATELITRAPILFLDEPTSNLDAFQAFNVMNCLRRVASGGRAVVCTIHQPRSSIYALFDQLLLLSQGKIVYYGDAKAATDYFNRQGFAQSFFWGLSKTRRWADMSAYSGLSPCSSDQPSSFFECMSLRSSFNNSIHDVLY
jgi:ABC-type multidrug transport system ATPase subunit